MVISMNSISNSVSTSALERAIADQEFRLHYQPIVSLKTNRVAGFEALIRWQHPERGLLSPGEFIPLAEETGLILPIGVWVLREACRQLRCWQQQFIFVPPLFINVNLSGHQLKQGLPARVKRVLDETGLDPRCLQLELTETALKEDLASAAMVLRQLRSLGTAILLDDFGTGYSSLSYLHQLPVSGLKIAREFVGQIDNEATQAVLTLITNLAHGFGLSLIGEGIETYSQLQGLKELSCDYGQGFLFSRPVNSTAAQRNLAQRVGAFTSLEAKNG